ncbi:hypothetical protein [Geodermatophilus marinus]|uniref:hypothetical protein n=1 Tax=Geodermatophilus sp. LHW52908 TaxID=2303986 RepID=UPI000E3DF89B|nr:hypothetical protein [Geodermatophilus sp. LHW52908]RFU21777.1 hypothetical protein D0Z06_09030 [Geodermatophilus sp. LHW52908]
MESSAPAAVPWVVLAVALTALAVLGVAAARAARRHPRQEPPPGPPAEAGGPAPAAAGPRWAHDDLPGFLAAPPGTAAEEPPPPPAPARPPGSGGRAPDAARPVVTMAGAALALVAALAVVAGSTGAAAPAGDPPPVAGTTPGAGAPPGPPVPPAPPPDLPGVPAEPLPGEGGAGALAARSVPLGTDGLAARLAFGGVVLERHAVGVTVAYPSVSVTATGDPVTAALAHLRLDTWNCLAGEAPDDPEEAGCVRTRTAYAELPTPALGVEREGPGLRLTGRFPTYTRPLGGPATYTGRVYDVTVTVAADGPLRAGTAPATGTFFLGADRAGSRGGPGVDVLRVVG